MTLRLPRRADFWYYSQSRGRENFRPRRKENMKRRSSPIRLSAALLAAGAFAFAFTGCERQPEAAADAPSRLSPESYMNDPAFRKAVGDARLELNRIAAKAKPMRDRMQELVKQHGEDLGKLQNVPEWVRLNREVKALVARAEALRKRQLATVRERLTPDAGASAEVCAAPGAASQPASSGRGASPMRPQDASASTVSATKANDISK